MRNTGSAVTPLRLLAAITDDIFRGGPRSAIDYANANIISYMAVSGSCITILNLPDVSIFEPDDYNYAIILTIGIPPAKAYDLPIDCFNLSDFPSGYPNTHTNHEGRDDQECSDCLPFSIKIKKKASHAIPPRLPAPQKAGVTVG
jgi:hypothetical protein